MLKISLLSDEIQNKGIFFSFLSLRKSFLRCYTKSELL
uniref:Uncharacterized protein n=1 Tax=Arundo donax TaxID=35708 RepID=A0A0A8XZ87_ARUDO